MVLVSQKIREFGQADSQELLAEFRRMANLTALKQAPDASFHYGHWLRGPLLYGLVHKYRPATILEFGTGRGYGCLSMAKAAHDAGIECTIYSIDIVPPDRQQNWAIDEGGGPTVTRLALRETWNRHFPQELTSKIKLLTGDSRSVMRQWKTRKYPAPDLVFIDAGHGYMDAKHDLISAVRVSSENCTYVFDDYTTRKNYGVNRLLDSELAHLLPEGCIEILDMEANDLTEYGEKVPHMMALLYGQSAVNISLKNAFRPLATMVFHLRYSFWTVLNSLKRTIIYFLRRVGVRK